MNPQINPVLSVSSQELNIRIESLVRRIKAIIKVTSNIPTIEQ